MITNFNSVIICGVVICFIGIREYSGFFGILIIPISAATIRLFSRAFLVCLGFESLAAVSSTCDVASFFQIESKVE